VRIISDINPMNDNLLRILVLDDDPAIRNMLKAILDKKAIIQLTGDPEKAFAELKKKPFDILITDFLLPGMNGLNVLSRVRKSYPETDVVMISSGGEMDTVIEALRRGASDFIRKPFSADDLWLAIERIQKLKSLNISITDEKRKNARLRSMIEEGNGLEEIIGTSGAIAQVKKLIAQVATTHDTSVLILGESGSGKELVARGIHKLSSRKKEVFAAVNMSAIPESLFESEFFGHKKGSFTGAIADKAGWFELTDKGTLFFDEIGEMNMSQQVKLLRVLEDRKYSKVGGQKEQSFDTRIIAATNKSAEEISNSRLFRSDLYFRLSTYIIQIPPLRDRREDIPLLARHFFGFFISRMKKPVHHIDPEVFEILSGYRYPGNVRELKNLIERSVILCDSDTIRANHFPDFLSRSHDVTELSPMERRSSDTLNDLQSVTSVGVSSELEAMEREAILRTLKETGYNKAEAARLLHIHWNALHRKMKKYGIRNK
jgi:DNA-binding NtrC family response regulator